jgi:hypothetical protein
MCARTREGVPHQKNIFKKNKKLLKNPLKTLYFFIFSCYYVRALDMRRQKNLFYEVLKNEQQTKKVF